MKILIAEDDFTSRKILYKLLSQYGECDITVDGIETVEAFVIAHDMGEPYDILCLDIMMPKIDGLKALKTIRDFEVKKRIGDTGKCKVIVTSALNEAEVAFDVFRIGREIYLTKPISAQDITEAMEQLTVI